MTPDLRIYRSGARIMRCSEAAALDPHQLRLHLLVTATNNPVPSNNRTDKKPPHHPKHPTTPNQSGNVTSTNTG
jgi:hypothetical protein